MKPITAKLRFYCFMVLLFLSFATYAQTDLLGRVVDESNNVPLQDASVFFNNTTIGTETDEQGEFFFETVRMLNTELVIYCPGYELMVYKPNAKQVEGKRMVFKLRQKEAISGKKPAILAVVKKGFLAVFTNNFLGITEEASKSKIINDSLIYFGGAETKTSFRAFADSPLVIINNMLGYKIIYILEDFWYDNATGENNFVGYARYEELGSDKKMLRNRRNCYLGSTLHFYRSLVAHQLYNEGFGAFLVKEDSSKLNGLKFGEALIPVHDLSGLEPISDRDLLYIDDNNNFSIKVTGKLLVQYGKNTTVKNFFVKEDEYISGYLPEGVESYIQFKEPLTGINYAGVLNDYDSVSYSGYWVYERLANRLPVNYKPEK